MAIIISSDMPILFIIEQYIVYIHQYNTYNTYLYTNPAQSKQQFFCMEKKNSLTKLEFLQVAMGEAGPDSSPKVGRLFFGWSSRSEKK